MFSGERMVSGDRTSLAGTWNVIRISLVCPVLGTLVLCWVSIGGLIEFDIALKTPLGRRIYLT